MFATLSLPLLIFLFLIAGIAVWYAGTSLSNATSVMDERFGIGQVMGGLVFLAIATSLPEITVVISASLTHNVGIAIGNILGGIAIQTFVLVILDGFGFKKKAALSYEAASLQLVLEGLLVIGILVIAIMGAELPQSMIVGTLAPGDLLIVIAWGIGLWLIHKARKGLPWHEKGRAPDTTPSKAKKHLAKMKQWSLLRVLFIFSLMAVITLIGGVVLEQTGSEIARQIGWSGVLFGATILSAITALPELSTGFAAVRNGDYALAVSDIFGGNAFLPVLFLPATLILGQSVLPQANGIDVYLASLGILLTVVYLYGLLFRPKRQFCCLGIDSIIVLLLYALGTAGLFVM